jgi:hypothetical protein
MRGYCFGWCTQPRGKLRMPVAQSVPPIRRAVKAMAEFDTHCKFSRFCWDDTLWCAPLFSAIGVEAAAIGGEGFMTTPP